MAQQALQNEDSAPGNAIVRPDNPQHGMVLERVDGAALARVGDRILARSTRALRVREFVGGRTFDPVIYFPPEDVDGEALAPTDVVTTCPLKGEAVAFDVTGERGIERGAWSYQKTHDFDRRLAQLECCVAFDRAAVTLEILG